MPSPDTVELARRGVILERIFEDDTILLDAVDPYEGVVIGHHRTTHKIAWARLRDEGEPEFTTTELDHGQNILCAFRFPLFAYDISGSALGGCASKRAFRIANVVTATVIADEDLPEHCVALEIDEALQTWAADVAGKVFTYTPSPRGATGVFRQSLPDHQQPVALASLPPGARNGTDCMAVVTQTHLFLLGRESEPLFMHPLPDVVQHTPPDIHIKVQGTEEATKDLRAPIALPSLDGVDHVWQARCLGTALVVLLQNSVLLKPNTPGSEWIHIHNMPGIMDAVEGTPDKGAIALSHINGDIFIVNADRPGEEPTIATPRGPRVIGRKADANSHMLYATDRILTVARPEGMIDSVSL